MDTKTFNSLVITIFLFVVSLQFTGCGNDNAANNNNGGNGTLLFSMDSLVLNVPENGFAKDTSVEISNAPNIKVSFDCSTNADSINSFASFRIIAFVDTNLFIDSVNRNLSQLNSHHTIYISGTNFYYCSLMIQLIRNDMSHYFIRFNNIRVNEN